MGASSLGRASALSWLYALGHAEEDPQSNPWMWTNKVTGADRVYRVHGVAFRSELIASQVEDDLAIEVREYPGDRLAYELNPREAVRTWVHLEVASRATPAVANATGRVHVCAKRDKYGDRRMCSVSGFVLVPLSEPVDAAFIYLEGTFGMELPTHWFLQRHRGRSHVLLDYFCVLQAMQRRQPQLTQYRPRLLDIAQSFWRCRGGDAVEFAPKATRARPPLLNCFGPEERVRLLRQSSDWHRPGRLQPRDLAEPTEAQLRSLCCSFAEWQDGLNERWSAYLGCFDAARGRTAFSCCVLPTGLWPTIEARKFERVLRDRRALKEPPYRPSDCSGEPARVAVCIVGATRTFTEPAVREGLLRDFVHALGGRGLGDAARDRSDVLLVLENTGSQRSQVCDHEHGQSLPQCAPGAAQATVDPSELDSATLWANVSESFRPVRSQIYKEGELDWVLDEAGDPECWADVLGKSPANYLRTYWKWDACMAAVRDHEWEKGERYDWVALTRPDVVFGQPARPWCMYERMVHRASDWAFLAPREFAMEFYTSPFSTLRHCRSGSACCRHKHYRQGEDFAFASLERLGRPGFLFHDNSFLVVPYRRGNAL